MLTSKQQLTDLLSRYGIPEASESCARFLAYLALLEKWGCRFNLVGSLSWDSIGPFFEEGLWAGERYPKGSLVHLDIGSGAGFPALPMRIIHPGMRLHLIESRTKRAVFLETACAELGLTGVRVHHCTLRTFLEEETAERIWDSVSWKALKLRRADLVSLVNASKAGTEFWIFHGEAIPVEGFEIGSLLRLCRRDSAPARRGWSLSLYRKTE